MFRFIIKNVMEESEVLLVTHVEIFSTIAIVVDCVVNTFSNFTIVSVLLSEFIEIL